MPRSMSPRTPIRPLSGRGVAATPPIALTFPGGIATFALNYGSDFTLAGSSLDLAAVNVNPGTYGDATHVAQVSVDAKGRTTTAASVIITHAANDLVAANNLSDLTNPAVALTNLGALAAANNLSDLASPTAAANEPRSVGYGNRQSRHRPCTGLRLAQSPARNIECHRRRGVYRSCNARMDRFHHRGRRSSVAAAALGHRGR